MEFISNYRLTSLPLTQLEQPRPPYARAGRGGVCCTQGSSCRSFRGARKLPPIAFTCSEHVLNPGAKLGVITRAAAVKTALVLCFERILNRFLIPTLGRLASFYRLGLVTDVVQLGHIVR
jgi:hypothetical protein